MLSLGSLALRSLPPNLQEKLVTFVFEAMPLQLHAIVLGTFASAIAPFGMYSCAVVFYCCGE